MGWNDDLHGLVFKSAELKLYRPSHTYAMKIGMIWHQRGMLRILTYSLPNVDYVRTQLGRRPVDILLLAHEKFRSRALELKAAFPDIRIALSETMHSKVVAIEPKTLYIGSANFGSSGWHETVIGVRSKEAHDYFISHIFHDAWQQAQEVQVSNEPA